MYESDRNRALTADGALQFNLTDWQCYLATWFFPSGHLFSDAYVTRRTGPYQDLGLPDYFAPSFGREYTPLPVTGDPMTYVLRENIGPGSYGYCNERLSSGSY